MKIILVTDQPGRWRLQQPMTIQSADFNFAFLIHRFWIVTSHIQSPGGFETLTAGLYCLHKWAPAYNSTNFKRESHMVQVARTMHGLWSTTCLVRAISVDRCSLDLMWWRNGRDRIVVSTSRCGRDNPGSNPGHGRDAVVDLCYGIANRFFYYLWN